MKIVTWNTQACVGLDGRAEPVRIARAARALADFDVLCLQEIAVDFPALTAGSAQDQPALLRSLLRGFALFFLPAVDVFDADGTRRRFGNLVATRLPVAQVRNHMLPYPAESGVESIPRACGMVTVRDPDLGAVRIMTTHLEFYSRSQRLAQALAVRDLHREYCAQADAPPAAEPGSPGALEPRTRQAVVCGDFNLPPHDEAYELLTGGTEAVLCDAWPVAHRAQPHAATFCVHEQRYLPHPIACDFFFVSEPLRERVRQVAVDAQARDSDHQPVLLELG